MTCPICGQLPGDPMLRPFGCFGRGERECTLRASEALGKHGRPLAWAADELRRELADAKAEVERLRKLFDDAGQGEHNVLALVDHYIAEAEKAEQERDDAADMASANAQWVRHYQREREKRDVAVAEADELRRLAWEWCIEAKRWSDAAVIRADWADGFDVRIRECGHVIREEPPIESLGPVPADVPGSLRSRVEWLVRDAVRRGAKLEGE